MPAMAFLHFKTNDCYKENTHPFPDAQDHTRARPGLSRPRRVSAGGRAGMVRAFGCLVAASPRSPSEGPKRSRRSKSLPGSRQDYQDRGVTKTAGAAPGTGGAVCRAGLPCRRTLRSASRTQPRVCSICSIRSKVKLSSECHSSLATPEWE